MTKVPIFHMPFNTYKIFADVSGNNNSVISAGTVTNGHGIASKYSAFFNGDSGNYTRCYIPSTNGQSFTWCAWVMKNTHAVGAYPIFMSFGLPYIACDGGASAFRFSYTAAVGGAQTNLSGTTIPALNTWYHVAVTSSASSIKIYVNGALENTTTTLMSTSLGTSFDIGQHYGDVNYRVWGRIDDVRVYNSELSLEEIQDIYTRLNNPVMMMKNNGDLIVNGLSEEIEWTLMDAFISTLDNEITPFDASKTLGLPNINSGTRLTAAGWTQYIDAIESTGYTRVKGFLQQFYGNTPIGYIEKALPAGYTRVRVRWANWYTGTATLKIGGNTIYNLEASAGIHEYAGEYTGTPTIRFEENGIFWVSEVWVGNPKTSASIKAFEPSYFNIIHNKTSPNLHPYDGWTVGSGSSGNFVMNGQTSENARIMGADPWNRPTVLWECRPEGGNNDDGGWNHNAISIDRTKTYRVSVWAKRNSTNTGNFYLGCNGYGTVDGVLQRSDGANNTNPYFYVAGAGFAINTWNLVVGHIWPAGSGTGAVHSNTGVYNRLGAKIATASDFIWRAESLNGRARCYLYYTPNTVQRQWMCYPTFEVCDGTEAHINKLISGRAYTPLAQIPFSKRTGNSLFELSSTSGSLLISGDVIIK